MDDTGEFVWVVRGHDQYENSSYTESVWTNEAAAIAHVESKRGVDVSGRPMRDTWPYDIDKVRLDTPAGYE